jgi:TnpA family transposase
MSIQFLSEEQQQGYGRYAGEPTSLQLARYFHLDDTALKIVKQRRGDHNRLGFAVQLCTVRFLGTFLINPIDVPLSVVAYLALQLDISSPDCLPRYLARPTTHWEHAQLIKQLYGYQDFSSQPYQWRLQRWLYERAWVSDESPSVLFDLTTARLIENKILLPGVTVLIRLIGSVRERVSQRAWTMVSKLPTAEQQNQLESILSVNEKTKQTLLDQLRCSPTRYSAPALVEALNRLVTIRAFGIRKLNVTKIPPNRLKSLTRTALTVRAQAISRMSQKRRIAVLVAFIYVMEAIAIDDTLDLLQLLVKDLLASSEREGKKERLRTLQRGKKPSTLAKAIGELGRVSKTLYLLHYVDDEDYRRRILTQLNRGESRHSLARAVFYGRRGELRQAYREGQEEQLGALGLVVNVLVLWNTYYMDAGLNYVRSLEEEVNPLDVARLSPLGHDHINMLGRYHFHLPELLKNGGMRPLRHE